MADMATDLPESKDANDVASGWSQDEHMSVDAGPPMTELPGHDFMGDLVDEFNDPFWQDMYKVNEWDTNFSALLGWGSDDMTGPSDAFWKNTGSLVS